MFEGWGGNRYVSGMSKQLQGLKYSWVYKHRKEWFNKGGELAHMGPKDILLVRLETKPRYNRKAQTGTSRSVSNLRLLKVCHGGRQKCQRNIHEEAMAIAWVGVALAWTMWAAGRMTELDK